MSISAAPNQEDGATDTYVATHAVVVTMDSDSTILPDGAIWVDHDRIVAIGPTDNVLKQVTGAVPVWDCSGLVIGPALVDAHCHLDRTGFAVPQGIPLKSQLEAIFRFRAEASEEDIVANTVRGLDRHVEKGGYALASHQTTRHLTAAMAGGGHHSSLYPLGGHHDGCSASPRCPSAGDEGRHRDRVETPRER